MSNHRLPPERLPSEPGGPRPGEGRARKPRGIYILLFLLLLGIIFFWGKQSLGGRVKELSIDEFYNYLQNGRIKTIRMKGGDELVGELAAGEEKQRYRVVFPEQYLTAPYENWEGKTMPRIDDILHQLNDEQYRKRAREKAGAPVTGGRFSYERPSMFFSQFVLPLIPWVLLILLLWYLLFRQFRAPGGTGGILSFGRSRARLVSNKDQKRVTFDDVAGIDEAKEEVSEIIEFLRNPKKFQRLGARIPRGILLVGPPGTGKTLLAKAIAGEAGVPFFSICGSDFVEMFVGVGASRVRDLFRRAKENSPSIIFLDEIDAVGRRRGSGLGGGHDEREQTLNAILVEMDGFDTTDDVIVCAATNRPDVLDPALLRPGRFDREIVIDMPDVKGREEILRVHARRVVLAPDVDLSIIARTTPMFSGADLEAVINEAALRAVMNNRDAVTMEDLEEARDKVRWGRQRRSKVMEEEDRRITAFHEAGHALVAKLLPKAEPLHKVTIIPRGVALGATLTMPDKDRYHMQREFVKTQITVLYAGRCAEEVFCEDISAGARNDIKQATELIRAMVCEWGMSNELGPISYSETKEHIFLGQEIARTQHHSEETAQRIDREIGRVADECYQTALELVRQHRDACQRIAQALLKYEVLSGEEVEKLIKGVGVEQLRKKSNSGGNAAS